MLSAHVNPDGGRGSAVLRMIQQANTQVLRGEPALLPAGFCTMCSGSRPFSPERCLYGGIITLCKMGKYEQLECIDQQSRSC